MKNVIVTVTDEGVINVLCKDDEVNLIILNTDHLEDYTFLYKDNEVFIDSINEDNATANLGTEDEELNRFYMDVPIEDLEVIEGEEYF